MKNKNILVIVSGSIAAYKAVSLVSFLTTHNNVKVMMTEAATKFVTPLTFEAISHNKVLTDQFCLSEGIIDHIYFAQNYDMIVVAPATANIIGKVANGIADDLATSTLMAKSIPVIFVPTMNTIMYGNPIVQENIRKLKRMTGYYFVEPDVGNLACGTKGVGKYPNTEKIVQKMKGILGVKK